MAFPGTYNINYYKGDTFEFRVYPKNSNGEPFMLTGLENEDVTFSFSTSRGPSGVANNHECFAQISTDKTYVLCAIRPADSNYVEAGTTYVYDVQVTFTSAPYNKVYTLLTGTITVTDQVTGAS